MQGAFWAFTLFALLVALSTVHSAPTFDVEDPYSMSMSGSMMSMMGSMKSSMMTPKKQPKSMASKSMGGKTPSMKTPSMKTPSMKTPSMKTPSMKTPSMGGSTPSMGGSTPSMGGSTPSMGGSTPSMGGSTPSMGGSTPSMGGTTPSMGGTTPSMGGTAPSMGGTTPSMGASGGSVSSGGAWHGKGIDLSSPCSASGWACLKSAGYSYAVIRIFMETNRVDPNGVNSVKAAHAAGFATDVYMFPSGTSSSTGKQQAQAVLNAIKGLPVGRVWIDIEGAPPAHSWSSSTSANSKLFTDIASTLTGGGAKVGVYTQGWQWQAIMGNGFTGGKQYPVWYAEYGAQKSTTTADGTCQFTGAAQSLASFKSFGGWTSAYAKQYNGNCNKCGCSIDVNFAP